MKNKTSFTPKTDENLIIYLENGVQVSAMRGSYVFQVWHNGKWHNRAVFPNTKRGEELANLVFAHSKGYVKIERFF